MEFKGEKIKEFQEQPSTESENHSSLWKGTNRERKQNRT